MRHQRWLWIGLAVVLCAFDDQTFLEQSLKNLRDSNPWVAGKAAYSLAAHTVKLDEALKKADGVLKERLEAVVKRRGQKWKDDLAKNLEKEFHAIEGTVRAVELKAMGLLHHFPDKRFFYFVDPKGKYHYGNVLAVGPDGTSERALFMDPKVMDEKPSWWQFLKKHKVRATSKESALELAQMCLHVFYRDNIPNLYHVAQEDSKWVVYFSRDTALFDVMVNMELDEPPKEYMKFITDKNGYPVELQIHFKEDRK